MLPHQQSGQAKRNHRHHAAYHPYYSSSPVTTTTVTLTIQNQIATATAFKEHEYNEEETYAEIEHSSHSASNTPNKKFNLFYLNKSGSNNNSIVASDLDNDLSTLSTKTNPPTTPVSSTNCDNSFSQAYMSQMSEEQCRVANANREDSLSSSFSTSSSQQQQQQQPQTKESMLYVTPATASSASSIINFAPSNDAESKSGTSSVSVCSSVVATYSRSSSMNSLNSFDIKSTHSSVPSEYSSLSSNPSYYHNNVKNDNLYSTKYQGFMTPTGYSELPNSPGELFPCNQLETNTENYIGNFNNNNNNNINNNYTNLNSVNNSAASNRVVTCASLNNSHFNSSVNTAKNAGINEISVLTVDSNPSKSNDITVIERTVLAAPTYPVNVFSYSQEDSIENTKEQQCNADLQTSQKEDEEDKVILYDMEGSLWETASSRSNVSSLTFPSEPTADLAFIRNLLSKKSTPLNGVAHEQHKLDLTKLENLAMLIQDSQTSSSSKQQEKQEKKPQQWSNYSAKSNSFTPPVKLQSEDLIRPNKKLFTEECCDDDETRSIASLPSEIAFDRSVNYNLDKSNFSALFNKLDNSSKWETSDSPCLNPKRQLFYLKENELNNSPVNFNLFKHGNKGNLFQQDREEINKQQEEQQSFKDDNDEQFLNDFIDEMLPSVLNADNMESQNEPDEFEPSDSEEELEEPPVQSKYQLDRNAYVEGLHTRLLPKIDEVENENDDSRIEEALVQKSQRRMSCDKLMPKLGKHNPVVVQMTKTTRLRVSKIKSTQQAANLQNVPVKRTQPTTHNNQTLNKTGELPEKRQALKTFNYNMPTKSSSMKSHQNNPNPNVGLTASAKKAAPPTNTLNPIKTSKSFNSHSSLNVK